MCCGVPCAVPSHPQSWDAATGCALGRLGQKVLAGIRTPQHPRAEVAGKAALFLGCLVLLDLLLVPLSSQLQAPCGSSQGKYGEGRLGGSVGCTAAVGDGSLVPLVPLPLPFASTPSALAPAFLPAGNMGSHA